MHYDIVLKLRRTALPFPDQALFSAKQIKKRLVKELGVDQIASRLQSMEAREVFNSPRCPKKVLTRGPEKARAAMLIGFDPLQSYLREAERDWVALRFFSPTNLEDLIGVAEAKDGASWCSVTRVTGRL